MSDGGTNWRPPEPSPPPPPPGGFAPPSPTTSPMAPVEPVTSGGGRSKGKVIAAAVGAVAIVGAGVFAITRISGDSASSGGADSPEAAANQLLDALDAEDALGAVDVLLPGERETFREPMQRFVTRLKDWDVLSDDSLSGVSGLDVTVTDRDIDVDETNVDDIVNLTISASVGGSVTGDELPIGDWLREQIGEDEIADLDEQADPEEGSFPVTAVRKDGRWYLSLFYTAAEQARSSTDLDIPEEGIAPTGGDSPEAAMDTFLDAVADLDLRSMVAALNPNEFEALQRYGPLFIDDGQEELDNGIRESDVSIDVGDAEYDVSGEGSKRSVRITALSIDVAAEGDTVTATFEDGCAVIQVPDQDEVNSCDLQQAEDDIDWGDIVDDPEAVEQAIDDLRAAFADYENPGFIVQEVDGSWYVSPMATVADQVLAVMEALSRDEIESLSDQITELVETFEDEFVIGGLDVPDFDDFEPPTVETLVPDTLVPDSIVPDTIVADDSAPSSTYPEERCYTTPEAAEAGKCFQELIDGGTIEPEYVPWYFRFPECGAAETIWEGDYYSLPDAEFVAQVEAWQPCVQGLISSGAAEPTAFDEVGSPECLEGRNPFLLDPDDEISERIFDCVYG